MRAHIDGLQAQHPLAGAKYPDFTFHLSWLSKQYRDALFVYVMRNPVETAKTIITRVKGAEFRANQLEFALSHSTRYHSAFTQALRKFAAPMLLLTYEQIQNRPESFLAFLKESGVPVPDDEIGNIVEHISQPGYKTLEAEALKR